MAGTAVAASVAAGFALQQWNEATERQAEAERFAAQAHQNADQAINTTAGFVSDAVRVSDELHVPRKFIEVLLMRADTAFERLIEIGVDSAQLHSERAQLLMLFADHYRIIGDVKQQHENKRDSMLDVAYRDPLWAEREVPIKRLGSPEDIAEVVVFLASERSAYMTGATIDVNGGWVMY